MTLIHRRDELRAEKILQDRLFKKKNVEIIWDSEVTEVTGKTGLISSADGVNVRNRKTGEEGRVDADGIFIAIGHAPAVELFKEQLKLKDSGYLWTAPDSTATEIPGVYAAGDVTDDIYRQAVTAAGMGCMAALEAERFIAEMEADNEEDVAA